MKAYSDDLREKVIKALNELQPVKEVAIRFDVCVSWVYKIFRRYKTTGSYKALSRPGAPRKLQNEDVKKLEELVKENPSATLEELKQMSVLPVGRSTIHRILTKELKITYKKNTFCGRTEQRRCKAGSGKMGNRKQKLGY